MSDNPRHMAVLQSREITRLREFRENLSRATVREAEQIRDEAFEKLSADVCRMQSAVDCWNDLLKRNLNPYLLNVGAHEMVRKQSEVQNAADSCSSAEEALVAAKWDYTQSRVSRRLAAFLEERAKKSLQDARFEFQNREAEQAFINRSVRG